MLRHLQRRFGILDANLSQRINALPVNGLERLGDALFDFQSAAEVAAWLDDNAGENDVAH